MMLNDLPNIRAAEAKLHLLNMVRDEIMEHLAHDTVPLTGICGMYSNAIDKTYGVCTLSSEVLGRYLPELCKYKPRDVSTWCHWWPFTKKGLETRLEVINKLINNVGKKHSA